MRNQTIAMNLTSSSFRCLANLCMCLSAVHCTSSPLLRRLLIHCCCYFCCCCCSLILIFGSIRHTAIRCSVSILYIFYCYFIDFASFFFSYLRSAAWQMDDRCVISFSRAYRGRLSSLRGNRTVDWTMFDRAFLLFVFCVGDICCTRTDAPLKIRSILLVWALHSHVRASLRMIKKRHSSRFERHRERRNKPCSILLFHNHVEDFISWPDMAVFFRSRIRAVGLRRKGEPACSFCWSFEAIGPLGIGRIE